MKKIEYLEKRGSVFDSLDIRKDPQKAFENAEKRTFKNLDNYMYMYSKNYRDYFKHYDTRNYISCRQYNIFTTIYLKIKERRLVKKKYNINSDAKYVLYGFIFYFIVCLIDYKIDLNLRFILSLFFIFLLLICIILKKIKELNSNEKKESDKK